MTNMDRGGLETMLMNYYRHIDREKIQFDFLVHREARAAYDDEIEALGGRIYRLPRLVPWHKPYLNALNDFFKEHAEYKVVHVHQDCLSSVILKEAELNGVPVRIAHSHNANQNRNIKYPIKLFYMKKIPRYATHLFACSTEAGEWMFGGHHFQIMNNAIEAAQFSFNQLCAKNVREVLGIKSDTFLLGHVGSFGASKNHSFIIDIFAKLLELKPDSHLLLVGDGGMRGEIENKVRTLGFTDKVAFTGVRSDVADLMQAMDVFVMPSLFEGLPVTLIEAQAAGLPCVISDVISKESIITDLVSRKKLTDSPEEWADTIIEKKEVFRRNTLSEIIAAGFDVTHNAKWLQEFYLEQWKATEKCQQ